MISWKPIHFIVIFSFGINDVINSATIRLSYVTHIQYVCMAYSTMIHLKMITIIVIILSYVKRLVCDLLKWICVLFAITQRYSSWFSPSLSLCIFHQWFTHTYMQYNSIIRVRNVWTWWRSNTKNTPTDSKLKALKRYHLFERVKVLLHTKFLKSTLALYHTHIVCHFWCLREAKRQKILAKKPQSN